MDPTMSDVVMGCTGVGEQMCSVTDCCTLATAAGRRGAVDFVRESRECERLRSLCVITPPPPQQNAWEKLDQVVVRVQGAPDMIEIATY